jgi:hypothetical protein
VGGLALARELEKAALPTGSSMSTFLENYGKTTAHRAPFLAAVVYGDPVEVTPCTDSAYGRLLGTSTGSP